MMCAVLATGAAFGQGVLPFDNGGGSGGGFGFGFSAGPQKQENFYTVTAKASVSTYQAGQSFYIALNGKVADTYHAYWRNPGSVGESVTATLKAPEGFKVEGPYFEPPHRVTGDFSTGYCYEKLTVVWKVTPEANAPQEAEFTAESAAQTCNDMGCNPAETQTATVKLSAGDGAKAADWENEESRVEVLGETPATVTATQTTQAVVLTIKGVDNIQNAYFFSEDNCISPIAEQTLQKTANGYTLTLPRNDNSDPLHPALNEALVGKELAELKGILTFDGKFTTLTVSFSNTAAAAAPAEAKAEDPNMPYYIYGGLLGLLAITALLTFTNIAGAAKPYILIPFYAGSAYVLTMYMDMPMAAAPMGLFITLTCYLAGFWALCHWCNRSSTVKGWILGALGGLLLISSFVYTALPREEKKVWQEWSPELMAQTLKEGKPVYVDFTATWCATCQMNKKVAYTEEVLKKFEDSKVVLMKADKTNPNEAIDAEMRRLGRTQVPVNVLYVPTDATKDTPEQVRYAITTELFGPDYLSEFIDKTMNDVAMETPQEDMGFWKVVAFLFIGGFILNFMPCVFPVIGLKVMSFVEMGGGSRAKVLFHSLAFVLGILLSFLALAVVLMLCFPAGERSWAVWMQNPWVVYGIVLLLLVLGLSMFGLFEIGVGATGAGQSLQNKEGMLGSFFQGVFITIVATPCSAPFLGSAMPLALALPDMQMVLAFCFMGLGLAFPYILLGAFPKLIAFLPRPGAWMESLKKALSFLLFGAAAWILSVYLAMYTGTPLLYCFFGLILICYACWIYGKWCPMYMSTTTRVLGLLAALITLAGGAVLTIPAFGEDTPAAQAAPKAQTEAPVATPAKAEETPAAVEEETADDEEDADEEEATEEETTDEEEVADEETTTEEPSTTEEPTTTEEPATTEETTTTEEPAATEEPATEEPTTVEA